MGKLSEEVAALTRRGATCTVGVWLATLSKAERADVDEVFASAAFSTTIAKAVEKAYGTRVGADAVQRHRRGACQCPR